MQLLPVNLTAIVAVIMAFATVLIPILGFTARYALKPLVEALGGFFDRKGAEETLHLLERRLDIMQQQIEGLQESLHRMEDVRDFHEQLGAGSREKKVLPPPPGP